MKRFVKAVGGMHHTVIYTDTDGRHYRFAGGTWAWRNHNPGNITPGSVSKRHNQIGVTHKFSIFPNNQCGHDALLDSLHTTYWNKSIHEMIYGYAPPKDHNPTKKYEKFLQEKTGVFDNRKIKKFTDSQFKKLWKAIEKFEDYKVGNVIEVFRISDVQKIGKNEYRFCRENGNWISEDECIEYAKNAQVELEVCISDLGTEFLRACPDSLFQKKLGSLIKK